MKHILEFRKLAALEFFGVQVRVSVGVEEESIVVDRANEEEHLGPSQGRNGGEGSNTVGNVVGREFSGDQVVVRAAEFGPDVSNDGKHGNTSVLELGSSVLVKGFLINVLGQAKRI